MALAVCVLFDAHSQRRIRQLWERLEDDGISTLLTHTHGRHHPHLSYAVLRSWDLDRVRDALGALPDCGCVDVAVQGTVLFPRGRAALACATSAALVRRQEQVIQALRGTGADLHRHYEPGRWVPHVSVATSLAAGQVAAAVSAVSDVLPLTLHGDRAALVETGSGVLWPLDVLP